MNSTSVSKLKTVFWSFALFTTSYVIKLNIGVAILLLMLALYLKFLYPNIKKKSYNLLNLSLLFVLAITTAYFIIERNLLLLYIPFSAFSMLVTILFGELMIALLFTFALSIAIAVFSGGNIYLGLLFLVSGLAACALVLGARRRITIIRAGFLVGLLQAGALLCIEGFTVRDPNRYMIFFGNGLLCSFIVVGILPCFEYLFKTVTNISLLELADFNQPLLQRLISEAPGTYHHSLIVGNLSEVACQAVGAHALLARIGAYYHDIGKLQKPEYFSENQSLKDSKHDALSPSMSKMVIMNHVKEGLELARKYKLSEPLLDFISQHHGDSLVFYFYRRALETTEEPRQIKEDGFRYPGPKPNTKETAIVLLADSVEAATRALREPSSSAIEEVVHKVINNKFIDRQLDECDLTLKDIEKISQVFIHILSGMYHGRVSYPEHQASDNHNKSTKDDYNNPSSGAHDKKSDF